MMRGGVVDHGVDEAYVYTTRNAPGRRWNGIISVDIKRNTQGVEKVYVDGIRVRNIPKREELELRVTSYTHPSTSGVVAPLQFDNQGVGYDEQEPQEFDLSFRTRDNRGNRMTTIVFNCVALPVDQQYRTDEHQVNIVEYSYDLFTRQQRVKDRMVSRIVVDERYLGASLYESSINFLEQVGIQRFLEGIFSIERESIFEIVGDGTYRVRIPSGYLHIFELDGEYTVREE